MYIDAGTGSMMLQVMAAGFFTVLVFFRQILTWCKNQFCKRGKIQESVLQKEKDAKISSAKEKINESTYF